MKQHSMSLWLLSTGARDSEGSWARQRATGGLPRAILGQVDLGPVLGAPQPPPRGQPRRQARPYRDGGTASRGAGRRGPSPGCAEPGGARAS